MFAARTVWLMRLACAPALLLPLSCASPGAARRQNLIAENLAYAAAHEERGEPEEAAQFYMAVLFADADNQTAQRELDAIGAHQPSMFGPSWLGANRSPGKPAPSPMSTSCSARKAIL